MDCKCILAQMVVGDGCDICNPTLTLDHAREEIESLRQQLAAALSVCEAKDAILRGITLYRAFNGDDWPAVEATQALAIKPDASALKAHDEALIERCLASVVAVANKYRDPNKADYNPEFGSWDEFEEVAAAIRELKGKLQ